MYLPYFYPKAIANAVESAPPEHPTIIFAPDGIFSEIKGKIFLRVLLVVFIIGNNNYVLLSCLGVICG